MVSITSSRNSQLLWSSYHQSSAHQSKHPGNLPGAKTHCEALDTENTTTALLPIVYECIPTKSTSTSRNSPWFSIQVPPCKRTLPNILLRRTHFWDSDKTQTTIPLKSSFTLFYLYVSINAKNDNDDCVNRSSQAQGQEDGQYRVFAQLATAPGGKWKMLNLIMYHSAWDWITYMNVTFRELHLPGFHGCFRLGLEYDSRFHWDP